MSQFSNSDKQEHGKNAKVRWNLFCMNAKTMLISKKL